jgi:flavodoxin
MNKTLVIYYSRKGENYVRGSIKNLVKGNTEIVAEKIAQLMSVDLFEVETEKPYAANYNACTEEARSELSENARPRLKKMLASADEYQNIIVAGPCWWGTYPMAIFTQLDALNLAGKNLFPVMTHEGSGLGHAANDLRKLYPQANIGEGLAIRGADVSASQKTLEAWVKRNF